MTKQELHEACLQALESAKRANDHVIAEIWEILAYMNAPTRRIKPKPDTTAQWQAFEKWYWLYPRKEARGAAETAWTKLRESDWSKAIEALKRQLKDSQSQINSKDRKCIPLPATYLNAKRWLDVVCNDGKVRKLPQCHFCSLIVPKTFITVSGKAYCNTRCKNEEQRQIL